MRGHKPCRSSRWKEIETSVTSPWVIMLVVTPLLSISIDLNTPNILFLQYCSGRCHRPSVFYQRLPSITLLTSILCISALLCPIEMNLSMSVNIRYALGKFAFKFHKNQIGDNVLMTAFKCSTNNCPYLKFY